MRAVVVREWTEPEALTVSEVPAPALAPGQVRIAVVAAGCNFFDTLIVRGRYQTRPAFPFSPGGEVSGRVQEVARGVEGFAVGDRVMAHVTYGGFAEEVCAPAASVHKIPATMSFVEAAAFPIVYGTSWVAALRGQLAAGETLLVTAAAGGVGLASVQIGRALGARVIALAGGAEKEAVVRRAGAEVAIDYREEDFRERVLEETDGRGADVIVENVGGRIFDECTRCIAWGGRLVVVGFSSGEIPTIEVNRVLLKHISLVGVHFPPMAERDPEGLSEAFASLFRLYEKGGVEPFVSDTRPLEALPDALAALESRQSWGKIVITLDAETATEGERP